MGCCCAKADGGGAGGAETRPATLKQKVQDAVTTLVRAVPNAYLACLLSPTGVILALECVRDYDADELAGVIASTKRAAAQFARSMEQTDCPVLRVQGVNNVFACYDVGACVLALYTFASGDYERGVEQPDLEAGAVADPLSSGPPARALASVKTAVDALAASGA